MTALAFRQWCSTAQPDGMGARGSPGLEVPRRRLANELVRAPADAENLAKALIRATSDEKGLAFLILGVQDLRPDVLQAVLDRQLTHPRLTLAADRATLEHFCSQSSDGRVGLMLDNVDVDTPLSSLIWEHLEAVRFSQVAVTRAARDLRTNCALESMLYLAKNLGLCAFGPSGASEGELFPGNAAFDYLPYPSPGSKAFGIFESETQHTRQLSAAASTR